MNVADSVDESPLEVRDWEALTTPFARIALIDGCGGLDGDGGGFFGRANESARPLTFVVDGMGSVRFLSPFPSLPSRSLAVRGFLAVTSGASAGSRSSTVCISSSEMDDDRSDDERGAGRLFGDDDNEDGDETGEGDEDGCGGDDGEERRASEGTGNRFGVDDGEGRDSGPGGVATDRERGRERDARAAGGGGGC